jgi:alkanesulfonate monooxygenase SsuD/methylene tetrahydromethanopterin reductase-like flavin-dependent oxidoreductase (luciferase family)
MTLKLGVFVVPDATDPDTTLAAIQAADRGLDLVGVQDHPYQRRFFDTWTLLSYAAGRTERVRLMPDVVNLPLRLPSVLAKSAASLDVLSGGRVELGVGRRRLLGGDRGDGRAPADSEGIRRRAGGGDPHPARVLVGRAVGDLGG